MVRNYLKTALRNMVKDKWYSLLNILGIAVGIGLFISIIQVGNYHTAFDREYPDADQLHVLVQTYPQGKGGVRHTTWLPAPLLPMIKDKLPEIEAGFRYGVLSKSVVRFKERKFYEERIWKVDENFISILGFKMVQGDPATALTRPDAIVLTEKMAGKYFGSTDPLGQVLTVNGSTLYTVTGITKDVPITSGFKYHFLVPLNSKNYDSQWQQYGVTFIRVKRGTDISGTRGKLTALAKDIYKNSKQIPQQMYLFPLTDVYFHGHHLNFWWRGETTVPVLVLMLGVILLAVVGFNYVNLSTARYSSRRKEVGMRKVCGASRKQLIGQFLAESVLFTLAAFPLALVAFEITKPIFEFLLTNGVFIFKLSIFDKPLLLLQLLILTVLLGVAAGLYPAFLVSRQQPTSIFRVPGNSYRSGGSMRKVLVILQFTLSIIIAIFTLVINKQFHYMEVVDVGFSRENLLVIDLDKRQGHLNINALKNELTKHKNIQFSFTAASMPGSWYTTHLFKLTGPEQSEPLEMNAYGIDYDFIEALDIQIATGRSFSKKYNDSDNYIISEKTRQHLGWEEPIGKHLIMGKRRGKVVGVAKNFHFIEMEFAQGPAVLYLEKNHPNFLYVKLVGGSPAKMLPYIRGQWQKFSPDLPFSFRMLDDYFYFLTADILKSGFFVGIIGVVIIIFSCLGLIGLASFTILQKTKEIGIRKVMGASIGSIRAIMLGRFVILIIIAILVACPVSFFVLKVFMNLFNYQVPMTVMFYVFVGAASLFLAAATIIIQIQNAAAKNPVESLRYE